MTARGMRAGLGWGVMAGVALLAAPEARAQANLTLELTPFAGTTLFLASLPERYALRIGGDGTVVVQDGRYEQAFAAGASVGVRLDRRFSIEAMGAWWPTSLESEDGVWNEPVDILVHGLAGRFHVPSGSRLGPFVGAGIGVMIVDYDAAGIERVTTPLATLLGGFILSIAERAAVRLEAREMIGWLDSGVAGVDDATASNLMLTTGLTWRLGL
jgi:hypothetical protein